MSWAEIKVRKPGVGGRRVRGLGQGWEVEGLNHKKWSIMPGFVHLDDRKALHSAGPKTWVVVRVLSIYAEWLTAADTAMRTGARIPDLPSPRLENGTPVKTSRDDRSIAAGIRSGNGGFVRVFKAPR